MSTPELIAWRDEVERRGVAPTIAASCPDCWRPYCNDHDESGCPNKENPRAADMWRAHFGDDVMVYGERVHRLRDLGEVTA